MVELSGAEFSAVVGGLLAVVGGGIIASAQYVDRQVSRRAAELQAEHRIEIAAIERRVLMLEAALESTRGQLMAARNALVKVAVDLGQGASASDVAEHARLASDAIRG